MKNDYVKGLREAYMPLVFGISLLLYSYYGDFNHLRRVFENLLKGMLH